nr:MAG TPA: hypothetical protein [Caudoviricetes sp.]
MLAIFLIMSSTFCVKSIVFLPKYLFHLCS